MNLNFDLNLLTILHVVLEERSVTRTGARLGRTQSAISNALKRLRDHFDDPLVVRTPGGLSPTPRAAELAPIIARIVQDADLAIAPLQKFFPAKAQANFAIGAPDRFNLPVLLPLLEHLGRVAPGMIMTVRTTDQDYAISLIDDGQIDIAIGWFDTTPPHLERRLTFEDHFVCLYRQDHPLADRSAHLSLDDILRYSHLVVSSTGDRRTAFDAVLQQLGERRKVAATLMSFTIVPEFLLGTNLIGVFTHRTAEYFVQRYPLVAAPVPLEVAPMANHIIWHSRFNEDAAHRWLRQRIEMACADSLL